jgi:transposase
MAERDMIVMSLGEVRRLKLIQSAIDRQISQKRVSSILSLSDRQVRRLVKAVREEGDKGIINRSRGRPSNRGLSAATKERVIALYKEKYSDFGPTLASEKIFELDGIRLSDEKLADRGRFVEEETEAVFIQAVASKAIIFWRNGSDGRFTS